MITENKITEFFCIADDFCKVFDAQMAEYSFKAERKRKYHSESRFFGFKLPVTDKSVKAGKKGKTIIRFTCNNSTATYDFSLELYPDGGAYINLSPSYADRIGYKGDWK